MIKTSIPSIMYLFALLYSFGLYGTVGRINISINLLIIIIICSSILYVGIFVKLPNQLNIKNYFALFDFNLFTISIFIFILLFYDLNLEISDDPFSHSYLAFQPAIEIIKIAYVNNVEIDIFLRYQASLLIIGILLLGALVSFIHQKISIYLR